MQPELEQMAKEYPVVTLLGPRQAGKTTLVKATFKDYAYLNMELPTTRRLALDDPQGMLEQYSDGVIIDEVQRVPELLSYIQVIVDEQQQSGQFILTGSHQLDLHAQITQSLAGRTALLNLLPLSLHEQPDYWDRFNVDQLLFNGMLPRIHMSSQQPDKAYRNYLQTYIERDVRQIVNVKDLNRFQKFMTLCASRIGQLINYDSIANELGISNKTVKEWLSILEASFIVVQLQPYFANIGKRLVKTPKLYFTEVGLAAHLLGIETEQQLSRDPLRGQLFENFVILELIKYRYNQGLDHHLYFYRDSKQHEVDVIFKRANDLIPIEIKSSKTYHSRFVKEIDYFAELFPSQCDRGYVIYAGEQQQRIGWRQLLHYSKAIVALLEK